MISVLLPTYNNAAFLPQSVRSILRQTVAEFELLVLDDGSTDHTEQAVQGIHDPRIAYHRLPHRGLTATLNEGLAIAKHDIIARMDADDLAVPWRFEHQLSALERCSRSTLLSSWYAIFSERRIEYFVRPPVDSLEIKKGLLLHSFIAHPGLMCHKEALTRNGGYRTDAEIDAFQDYETWLAMKDSVEFAVVPEVLMFLRYREESLSNNIAYKQRVMYSIQRPYYDDLRRHFGITDPVEANRWRGWREYFYGRKEEARRFWTRMGASRFTSPRLLFAWLVTFLPERAFIRFKEHRVRFRLSYVLSYWSSEVRALRKNFRDLTEKDEGVRQ